MYSTEIPYSTEEHRVGTWIDGKPLYRKTIKFTTTDTAYTMKSINTEISNPSTVMIDVSHSFIIGSDNCIYQINAVRPGSQAALYADAHNWFRFNPNKRDIAYVVGGLLTEQTGYITIEYTKTTD